MIHWFPGHMATARSEIKKAMPEMDLVIEVLDARIPASSMNPLVAEARGQKPTIRILNKSDLADPAVTAEWLAVFTATPGVRAVAHHTRQPHLLRTITALARQLIERPSQVRPMNAMIMGIPNVGKSTVVNTLAGRTIAKTGDKPAITQMQQRVQLSPELVLFDTPGFLWHKLDPPVRGYRLAVTGAVSDRVTDFEDLAVFAAAFLAERYPMALRTLYKLDVVPEDPEKLLEAIGRRRGFVGKGAIVDRGRAAERLILDLRAGSLGALSLERPGDP